MLETVVERLLDRIPGLGCSGFKPAALLRQAVFALYLLANLGVASIGQTALESEFLQPRSLRFRGGCRVVYRVGLDDAMRS
jgi:hypothetical protein